MHITQSSNREYASATNSSFNKIDEDTMSRYWLTGSHTSSLKALRGQNINMFKNLSRIFSQNNHLYENCHSKLTTSNISCYQISSNVDAVTKLEFHGFVGWARGELTIHHANVFLRFEVRPSAIYSDSRFHILFLYGRSIRHLSIQEFLKFILD